MRSDRPVRRLAPALAAVLLVSLPGALRAQAPLILVNSDTRLGSFEFRFTDGSSLDLERLEDATALEGRGFLAGVRAALDPLPGISAPTPTPFDPVTLQKDVVRLRRLYRESGYPDAEIDYEVTFDSTENLVDVTMLVTEGEPVTLAGVHVTDAEGAPPNEWLPQELLEPWRDFDVVRGGLLGSPYGVRQMRDLEARVTTWFRERGYPWANSGVVDADTTARSVTARMHVSAGPRARVDEVRVEGNGRLDRSILLREFSVEPGEWYDMRAVTEGEQQIFELEIVRRALADVAAGQPRDSTVTLRVRVEEGLPRMVWGRAGYSSESGVASEGHWVHRDFFGDARTFTVSGVAETGLLALEVVPARAFGASATVRQPYVGHRRASASFGPFVSYTQGVKSTSLRYGLDLTGIYRVDLFRAASLQYELSQRSIADEFPLLTIREQIGRGPDAPSPSFFESVAKLTGSYGWLNDARVPTYGYLLQPNLEVTTPGSGVDYVRLGFTGLGAVPIIRGVSLLGRATAGRLFPFGQSRPSDPTFMPRVFAGLRDVTFSAGGTRDVRGWAPELLGPKMPRIVFAPDGSVGSDGYVPVGGLARATAGLEALLPMPFLGGGHRTYLFFDSGRVWSPGTRYDVPEPVLQQEGWFHALGGGLQFATLVGPVRLGLGYKLNPSVLDLLSAQTVLRALLEGTPLSTLPPDEGGRWHIHLSLGSTR